MTTKDQMLTDMLDGTGRAISYWGDAERTPTGLTITDDHTGETKTLTTQQYVDAARTWAGQVKPEFHDYLRKNAAFILAGFWEYVEYDEVQLDLIAQTALHGTQMYS